MIHMTDWPKILESVKVISNINNGLNQLEALQTKKSIGKKFT